MLVMGGIVGSGIFINPYVVAGLVHTPALILGAWLAGGAIALAGAFIYAELADRMPKVGGQYAYIREAYHPLLGFLYGWISLLVIHAGGSAAPQTNQLPGAGSASLRRSGSCQSSRPNDRAAQPNPRRGR